MRSTTLILSGALVVNLVPIGLQAAGLTNESAISFKNAPDLPGSFTCQGKVNDDILKELEISRNELERGISCVVGDFDGNGYADFLLFGRIMKSPRYSDRPAVVSAVFYEGPRVLRHQVIIDSHLVHPVLYPATQKKGRYGEPISKMDGFVEWGEGGTTTVYLYNLRKRKFEKTEHISGE